MGGAQGSRFGPRAGVGGSSDEWQRFVDQLLAWTLKMWLVALLEITSAYLDAR